MNLTYTRPGELRKPDVQVLPDNRIRITRYIAAGHGDRDYSEVTEAVGTADFGLATALLVQRGMAKVEGKDAIVKVYEVRNVSSETLVGLPDVQYSESGQKSLIYDYIQMSTGAYVPGVIGTTTAPGDATCVLRSEQVEDDGTTRQIRRVFINKGLLQQSDETRNNGALLLKTFVYLNDAPAPNPPTGYTLISQRTENPNGLETTTYVYAQGLGQISRDDSTKNNGALLIASIRYLTAPSVSLNPITTPTGYTLFDVSFADQDGHRVWSASYAKGDGEISRDTRYVQSINEGATGATVISIRHLTASSVAANPIATPADTVLISIDKADQDGYRIWSAVYAKGTGTVSSSTDTREGGKLILYRKTALGAAPSAPSATIFGTVTLISDTSRTDSGYVIYERAWAEGLGEVARDIRYSQSNNQGTTGATVITIRHLTSLATDSNPIITPVDTVLISESKQDQEGYRAWSAIYAKGTGQIVTDVDSRNGNKLKIYHRVALGAAPTAPSPTIGGSVTLVSQNVRKDSGYDIYDYTWAEGIGIVAERIQYRDGGLRLINREIFLTPGATDYSPYTPAGIEVDSGYTEGEGVRRYSVTWMQTSAGGSPAGSTALFFTSKVPFTFPGRAKAYSEVFTVGAYTFHRAYDVFMSPPIQTLVDGYTQISYTTNNAAPSPSYTLWNPTDWATMRAKWIGWANSPRSKIEALRGYIAVNSGVNGVAGGSGTDTSVLGDRVYASTDWAISLSGGPSSPEGNTYTLNIEKVPAFTDTTGLQYYRVTETYASIPFQTALPV